MKIHNKIWMTLFALGTMVMGSCDSLIYDDLKDCPQGVYVKFYSMTPCDVDSTFIGKVPSLTLLAFDDNDVLAAVEKRGETTLDRDFEVMVPVRNGSYSFVAWAGVDDNFTVAALTPGKTTRKEVMVTLKQASAEAARLGQTKVWQGESQTVFLPDPAEFGSVYQRVAVNLQEVTNRLKVIVEVDESITELTARDLTCAVSSANGTLNIDRTMPLNGPVINYPILSTTYADNSVTWDFALMDLVMGYNNKLKIDWPEGEQAVFDGDLIGGILLMSLDKTNINLACENDFSVKFVVRNYCEQCYTHFSCLIYVNDWLVHSYETDLGI